jgi:hypothetical protein
VETGRQAGRQAGEERRGEERRGEERRGEERRNIKIDKFNFLSFV